ncbi:hypothetical protein M2283_008317 [Streptomyces pseudovenezuelae]|uniref:Fibronectin type-III domain-containing protein n=1 Tax=Streptomyces pseudovenezuelae TaxID=67350 RepID=A0ABT6LYP2_9ACTN|nr:hypothetical protein [Streptomyces pseudovenezuelae]
MRVLTRVAVPAALILALSACSAPQQAEAERPLRAALTTPTDVDLKWRDERAAVAGHVLEFATAARGPYTVLQYLDRQVTTYRHPDLMPRTTFYYRLRTYRGPASRPVHVDLPAGGWTAEEENADHDWLPARTLPGHQGARHALPAGAPTDLRAVVKDANGILFTWTDNSADEDGFLLEIRRQSGAAYEPLAVLDPDINSTGLVTLPEEKHASYRIRAFTLGERSNVVHLTTGE